MVMFAAEMGALAEVPAWSTDKALLQEVFPDASAFGPIEGDPAAVPAFKDGALAGYVFSSRQTVHSTGYAAKPLDVLVGLNDEARITGVRLIEHNEPILVIGVTDADLHGFVSAYRGLDIKAPVKLGQVVGGGIKLDAISRATISSRIINDAITRSARAVAVSRGFLGGEGARLDFTAFEPATWTQLVEDGSLRKLSISVGDATAAIRSAGGSLFPDGVPAPGDNESFLDLFVGLASPARVVRNLIGERDFWKLDARLVAGDLTVFVGARGLYSFKGRDYRKSGIFDRIELVQGSRSFRFRKQDHINIEMLTIEGAPDLREAALFVMAGDRGFDPAKPWRLQLLVQGAEDDGARPFALFEADYKLPDRYVIAAAPGAFVNAQRPLWQEDWFGRLPEIVVLVVALLVLTGLLTFQDLLARQRRRYRIIRLAFLTFTLVWLGWMAGAQLSVVNVITFVDALMSNFHWEIFLLEPLTFILWSYVAVTLLFWGRGVFCGWLCPFGALQELLNEIAVAARVPQLRLPFGLHERLWTIKYVIFLGLFAAFLHDPVLAFRGAEVEPFKTAIVLGFQRAWPFLVYVGILLAMGLFINRFFCRYLCPLGAALGIPARMRMFEWLKRRWQCGTPCQVCAGNCPVQAIHPEGRINPNECVHCLNCQVAYFDSHLCPPLIEKRKRLEKIKPPDLTPKAAG